MVFQAVATLGSIQAASDRVGMTQSAVTRTIQRLEGSLGRELFNRRQRPFILTPDGEEALRHAVEILERLDFMQAAFDDESEPAGTFRLGVPHALVASLLRPGGFLGLERFDRIRPSIYAGWSGDLRARLGRGDLEAAITIDADGREVATNAIHVGHARLQVVGRRQAAGSEIDIATANASGWALNPAGCGYRDVLSEALERLGLSLNIGLETNSTETQIAVAGSGRLYSLAPSVVDSVLLASAGADLLCCPEIDVGLNFQVTPAAHTGRMGVLDAVANAAARLLTK